MSKRKKYINSNPSLISVWEAIIIIVFAFVAYGNTIQNDYNIDDAYIVPLDSQNDIIKEGVSAIPTLLTSRYNQGEGVTYGYRPMGKITMVFEYMWWGNSPHNSHVVNILLYALNIILLLVFLRMLSIIGIHMPKQVIYIGLLLFIFHPIHTEVVASIKNREEILCFSFLIIALIFYLKFFRDRKTYNLIPFLIFLFLAILSKETALNVFGWLILLSGVGIKYTDRKVSGVKTIMKILGIFIIGIIISQIVFSHLLKDLTPTDLEFSFEQNPYRSYPLLNVVPNGIQTIFFYIKKLILPFPLVFYYGYNMLPVQDWSMILPYVGLLIIIAIGFYIIRNFILKKDFVMSFWLCVLGISIFPFANLVYAIYITGIVGERLVYQASFAFCMIIAIFIGNLTSNAHRLRIKLNTQALTLAVVTPILLVFLLLTIQRNTFWKDKRTLYEHDMKYLSNSARANFIMANHYMKTINEIANTDKVKQVNAAKRYFIKSIDVYPDYSDAKIKLASVYANYLGKPDSAIYYLATVKKDASQYYLTSLEILGDLYVKELQDEKKAVEYYQSYFAMDSLNERVYQKMMNIYFEFGAFQEIVQTAEVAMQNDWLMGYVDMGDAMFNNGEIVRSIYYYNVAIEKGYNDPKLVEKVNQLIHNK